METLTQTQYSLCHLNTHRHSLTQPYTLIVIHTVTVRLQSPTHNLKDGQAHTQKVPKSPRVTKSFSHPKYTKSNNNAASHNHNCTHLVTHTQSHKVSHTQTDTEQYSHTQRETDTHSCTQAPGDTEQWAHCLGWQQLGRKELQCGLRRPWGLLYPPPSLPQHPKLFLSFRNQLLLGPGFAEGLCSQAPPAQPLGCLVEDAGGPPLCTRLPLRLWELRVLQP